MYSVHFCAFLLRTRTCTRARNLTRARTLTLTLSVSLSLSVFLAFFLSRGLGSLSLSLSFLSLYFFLSCLLFLLHSFLLSVCLTFPPKGANKPELGPLQGASSCSVMSSSSLSSHACGLAPARPNGRTAT